MLRGLLRLYRIAVLLLPATLLIIASLRCPPQHALMLWLGAAFQLLVCCLSFFGRQTWRQPMGPSVVTLYVIALGWLWLTSGTSGDWFPHLAQAILLVVPLVVFAYQVLTESGVATFRRARLVAQRLASRKDWPIDLESCRHLPEVKVFRETLHLDATPALALLKHPRPQVRIAALAALEFHQDWRPGQAELLLQHAQREREPALRAAAVTALANVEDRVLVEALAEFLRDSSEQVRHAATEALLWACEQRWPWIRQAVRRSLSEPAFKDDGPLGNPNQSFPPEAVADMTAWAAEKGVLGIRAALTLGVHFRRLLSDLPDPTVIAGLSEQLANPHTPPALRMELALLLQGLGALEQEVLERLLDPINPAPLRLIAVESLLAHREHLEALTALRDLARLPNREIALATAAVVQRRLGLDLGLVPGQPLPPIHSRQAAEVTRRVMAWAAHNDQACLQP